MAKAKDTKDEEVVKDEIVEEVVETETPPKTKKTTTKTATKTTKAPEEKSEEPVVDEVVAPVAMSAPLMDEEPTGTDEDDKDEPPKEPEVIPPVEGDGETDPENPGEGGGETDPEPPEGGGEIENHVMYPFVDLPHRKEAMISLDFQVLYEINRVQEEHEKWWEDETLFEGSKYQREIVTLIRLMKEYENVSLLESRNGYYLKNSQIEAGKFYQDSNYKRN